MECNKMLSNQVAIRLGITRETLTRWYNKYENINSEDMPKLPKYEVINAGQRTFKVWSEDDIIALELFRDAVKKGRIGMKQYEKK